MGERETGESHARVRLALPQRPEPAVPADLLGGQEHECERTLESAQPLHCVPTSAGRSDTWRTAACHSAGKCRIHSSTLYPKGVQVRGSRCGDPCCPPRPRSAFPGLSGGGERGGRGSDSREGTGFSQSWVPGSVHSAHVHFLI